MDRGLGKCPRQTSHNPSSNPKAEDNDVGALREAPTLRESPSAISHNEPESPRLVTQIDDTLNQSLGPAPSAHIPTTKDVEPAPYSIRGAIRESPRTRECRHLSVSLRPRLYPLHYPTAYSRNHQQRPDAPRHPAGYRQGRRRPEDHTLPPAQGRIHPAGPRPRHGPQRAP